MNGSKPFSFVVLLTSTIHPPGASEEKARCRLQQYKKGIVHWMRNPDDRIAGVVYCDNSTPNLDWARDLANQQNVERPFEAIYCPDNKGIAGLHYGYQEMGIIDFSLNNSRLLARSDFFVKITGRLLFPRFSFLLNHLHEPFDICMDHRRSYKHENKDWATVRARTQMMLFRKTAYMQYLYNSRHLMAEKKIVNIEEFIPGLLRHDKACNAKVIHRWPVECPPSGVGGNGDNYDSLKRKFKSLIQGCARQIAPWIWL